MEREVTIEVRELGKTFKVGWRRREVTAVHSLSFEVLRGEIFAIVGPNGAGKTTTIKMLTGLIKPSRGSASIFGRPVEDVNSRRRIGYLPESPYFYEHLTAPELLYYYGALHGLGRAALGERVKELIELVGLGHAKGRPIRKFSKGMRQRAGLAQALINDPELVILDEPQSGLDPVGRKEVRDLIFDLKRQGKTVILSSHILPDVEAVCDRVAVLHKGQLQELGSMHELTSERTLHIEVLIRPMSEERLREKLDKLELLEQRGDLLMLRFEGDASVRTITEQLYALDAELLSISPQHENLEDVFMRDTYGAQATATQQGSSKHQEEE